MDKQQAQQLLELTGSVPVTDINSAFANKLDKNQRNSMTASLRLSALILATVITCLSMGAVFAKKPVFYENEMPCPVGYELEGLECVRFGKGPVAGPINYNRPSKPNTPVQRRYIPVPHPKLIFNNAPAISLPCDKNEKNKEESNKYPERVTGGTSRGKVATFCISVGVDFERKSQTLKNTCNYDVHLLWCPDKRGETGMKRVCGYDNKFYQYGTVMKSGRMRVNQYDTPLGVHIRFAACKGGYGTTVQDGMSGGYYCKQ